MVRLINDYTRACKITEQQEELCSCDFRLNLYECPHSGFYVIVGKILIPICAIVTMMAAGFLIYLVKFKKIPFFLPAGKDRGWLRPRPMHSYHLIVFFYIGFELIHLIALVNELYPSAGVAEFFHIMIVVPASCAAVFYTVSIVYSTPNIKFDENYELLNRNNGPNTRLVDVVGIVLFLQPIITWIPLSILTGHYVEVNDIKTANVLFTIHYLTIVAWELGYVVAIAYFWYKLMFVIKSYVKSLRENHLSSGVSSDNNDRHIEKITKGTRNITLPVMAIISGLTFQAAIYAVMSVSYRNVTIYYFGWNVFYYWTEYVVFPLIGLTVESCLLYYTITNIRNPQNQNSSSNNSKPSSSSQTQVNSGATINYTGDNVNNILCCRPIREFGDDSADTSNSPPSAVIIHYTSETNTVIEATTSTHEANVKIL